MAQDLGNCTFAIHGATELVWMHAWFILYYIVCDPPLNRSNVLFYMAKNTADSEDEEDPQSKFLV